MAQDEEEDVDRPSQPPTTGEDPVGDETADDDWEESGTNKKLIESILPQLIKKGLEKGIEAGIGTLQRTDKLREVVGDVVGDVKLPREIAAHVLSQIDDTKSGLTKVVAREVRDFLAATDVAGELQKALTSLSFEIKTEIRFIPNEAGTGVKPEVKAASRVRKSKKRKRESVPPARPASSPPAVAAADDDDNSEA